MNEHEQCQPQSNSLFLSHWTLDSRLLEIAPEFGTKDFDLGLTILYLGGREKLITLHWSVVSVQSLSDCRRSVPRSLIVRAANTKESKSS